MTRASRALGEALAVSVLRHCQRRALSAVPSRRSAETFDRRRLPDPQAPDLVDRLLTACVCVAVAAAMSIACSGCSRAPEGQPAAAARATARIPVVIAPPRPFRIERLSVRGQSPPWPVSTPATAGNAALSSRADNRPSTAALPEPGRFPGAPADARPAAAEIGLMLRDYARAFNRHDAVALAAHWSPTAENLDLDTGEITRGRAAMRDLFTALFATDPSGRLDLDIEAIRLVNADVAVVDALLAVSFAAPAAEQTPSRRRLSAVVVRRDDHWQIDSVREATIDQVPATLKTARDRRAARPLEELAFLVGTWEGRCAAATVVTRCTWAADGAFLFRTHLVTADRTPAPPPAGDRGIPGLLVPGSSGTREVSEIIAFDAHADRIRSWLFTSHGRFAEGVWSRSGDRWVVEVEGKGADVGTQARMQLERIGTGECVVASDGGGLEDVCPPACSFSRVD